MTYPLVVLLLTGNYDNQTAMSISPHLQRVGQKILLAWFEQTAIFTAAAGFCEFFT
jgi:hypothetical protein